MTQTLLPTAQQHDHPWCLVYADYPLGEPVMDALIGPLFFETKRKALQHYMNQLAPRLEADDTLKANLGSLDEVVQLHPHLVTDSSDQLCAAAETLDLEVLDLICSAYSHNEQSQGREVILLLEQVPSLWRWKADAVAQAEHQCVDAGVQAPASERRLLVIFHPQAWQNDYAIAVDPGPTQIDVTEEILAMGRDQALHLTDDSDESDTLRLARLAPDWVRDWAGPHAIECEDAIAEFFAEPDLAAAVTARPADSSPAN